MPYFRRSRFIRFVILPLTLVAFLPACHKWVGVNTAVDSQTGIPSPVRVTLMDGRQLDVEDVTVSPDSLFGRRKGTSQPVSLSLDEVQSVEQEKTDGLGTGLIIAGLTLTVLFVIAVASIDLDCLALEALERPCP